MDQIADSFRERIKEILNSEDINAIMKSDFLQKVRVIMKSNLSSEDKLIDLDILIKSL